MGYVVNQGSEERLESAIVLSVLAAGTKACSVKGCGLDAEWQKYKSDPKYDHYMRAHRVRGVRMEAKSPPGWGKTVEHMKEHSSIDNPHALAWYMHEKGDKPSKGIKGRGVGDPTHPGGMKAGGPGSGPHPSETANDRSSHKAAMMYHKGMMEKAAPNGMAKEAHRSAGIAHQVAYKKNSESYSSAARMMSKTANRLDLKAEGGIREMLEQRHESAGVRAKGKSLKSDTKVGDIQAPKKKKKVKAENLDVGVSMSRKR